MIFKYFFPFQGLPFHFADCVFCCKVLNSDAVQFIYFCCPCLCFCVMSERSLVSLMPWNFSSMFSSKAILGLWSTLLYFYAWYKIRVQFHSFACGYPLFSSTTVEKTVLFPEWWDPRKPCDRTCDSSLLDLLYSWCTCLIIIIFLMFVYLVVPDLNCSMWPLSCGMWDLAPWPGIEPGPQVRWEHRVLTIGPPRRSAPHWFDYCNFALSFEIRKCKTSNFVLLFQHCCGYPGSLEIPCEF